jgi:hypothetical protein
MEQLNDIWDRWPRVVGKILSYLLSADYSTVVPKVWDLRDLQYFLRPKRSTRITWKNSGGQTEYVASIALTLESPIPLRAAREVVPIWH